MKENFDIHLINPVERGVEHHKEAGELTLALRLFLNAYAKKKSLSTPPLGLLRIATATPQAVGGRSTNIQVFDDVVEPFCPALWDTKRPDIVGITCTTAASERAAYLVREATRRDINVVMGGPHTTVSTDNALGTGAAVVKGAGELVWPEILASASSGHLENKVYENDDFEARKGTTLPPRRFFQPNDYYSINVLAAGEGCPYSCSFCSTNMVKGLYQGRNLDDILSEIDAFRKEDGTVIITDDNFFLHPQVRDIIGRLGSRGLQWFATVSTKLTENQEDLVKFAGQNGCKVLFLGIDKFDLPKNRGVNFDRLIAKIKASGIHPSVGFVFGLGHQTTGQVRSEMEDARDFVMKNRIPMIHLSNAVPYPGTEESALKADRIVRPPSQWDTQGRTVYEPLHMSAEEMDGLYFGLCRDLYSFPNILRRLSSTSSIRDFMLLFFYNVGRFRHIQKAFAK